MKSKLIGFLLGLVGILSVVVQSLRLGIAKASLKRSRAARKAESKAHKAIIEAKSEGRKREEQINTSIDRDYFNNSE